MIAKEFMVIANGCKSSVERGLSALIIQIKLNQFIETRIKAGFTQRALARATGLTSGYMSQLERGDRHPSPQTAKKICQALDVEFEDLFELQKI